MFSSSQKLYNCRKQEPHNFYDCLRNFLLNYGFTRGKVDTTLYVKIFSPKNLITKIYVNDIIFGSVKISLSEEYSVLL